MPSGQWPGGMVGVRRQNRSKQNRVSPRALGRKSLYTKGPPHYAVQVALQNGLLVRAADCSACRRDSYVEAHPDRAPAVSGWPDFA
jgi:hypothetical protein